MDFTQQIIAVAVGEWFLCLFLCVAVAGIIHQSRKGN